MVIRKLSIWEYRKAFKLVMKVFLEFEAPDYSKEGVQNFQKTLSDWSYIRKLKIYGAFQGRQLLGVIATRNKGNHIALFFVKKEYHRQGIGRKLFQEVCRHATKEFITVNSSPYAKEVYHHLGFIDTDTEKETDGILYIPMMRYPERYKEEDIIK